MRKGSFSKKYYGETPSSVLPTKEDLSQNLAKFKIKTLVNFIENLPAKAKVLDAGCGKGKTIRVLMAYRPDIEIFAIDISNVKEFLPSKINFQIASVEQAGEIFKENTFDAVICQHVVEHLLYPMVMMENFQKILKNGGKLFLETPNWPTTLFPFHPKFFWGDYTHIRLFTKQTMKKLLEDYNFNVLTVKAISSSGVLVQDDSVSKVKSVYQRENASILKFIKKVVKTILVRTINPFLKDILVGIGINEKSENP